MTRRAAWQTAAVLLASLAIGRWLTGPGFGYTIFALVWTPVAAVCLPYFGKAMWQRLVTLGFVLFAALPWLFSEPAAAAGKLLALLLAWTLAVVAIRQGLGVCFAILAAIVTPKHTRQTDSAFASRLKYNDLWPSAAVSAVLWLTWLAVPLTRAEGLERAVGERSFGLLLSQNPLLAANAISPTAADWTHSAIAYRYFTVLGQDVAFDWPTSWATSLVTCGSVLFVASVAGLATSAIAKFHVEQ